MVQSRSNRRLKWILTTGLAVLCGLAYATPASAQGRFRVLVPKTFARQGEANKDFGEDVSKELEKLINSLPTHAPVEKGELKAALKQYKLDEDDLSNCITARQLAAQRGFELVLCGSYTELPGKVFEVSAQFVSPRENVTYDVPAFQARDDKEAAQKIFESFRSYVDMLRYSAFCMDHLASQQWEEALERCDAALAISENAESALYGRGYALMQLGQNEPAMEALKQLLEKNPIHQEGLMAAGFLAAKMGDMDASREYYRRYLEVNPGNPQVRLTIATDAANAGDPEGALQIAEEGLQGDSVNATLLEYAGYFAMQAAAKIEGTVSQGQNGGGTPPEAMTLYEKALGYFDRVFASQPDTVSPNLTVSYVNALVELGRTQEATAKGAEFVRAYPDNVALWNVYAKALKEAGRVNDALAALDTVLARDSSAQTVRALQAQWLLQAGQFARSKEAFRAAIERKEISGDQAARLYLSIGFNDKFQKRDYEGALPYFDAALEFATDPVTRGMAHFFTGYVLYTRGEKVQAPSTAASAREALPIFQKALEHFEKSRPYAETQQAQSLQQFLAGTQQYIEIQEALIKRGS